MVNGGVVYTGVSSFVLVRLSSSFVRSAASSLQSLKRAGRLCLRSLSGVCSRPAFLLRLLPPLLCLSTTAPSPLSPHPQPHSLNPAASLDQRMLSMDRPSTAGAFRPRPPPSAGTSSSAPSRPRSAHPRSLSSAAASTEAAAFAHVPSQPLAAESAPSSVLSGRSGARRTADGGVVGSMLRAPRAIESVASKWQMFDSPCECLQRRQRSVAHTCIASLATLTRLYHFFFLRCSAGRLRELGKQVRSRRTDESRAHWPASQGVRVGSMPHGAQNSKASIAGKQTRLERHSMRVAVLPLPVLTQAFTRMFRLSAQIFWS